MANADTPCGFKPYEELLHVGIYIAASTIYPGDAVKAHAGTSSTSLRKMQVEVAAASDALVGVALNYATAGQVVRVADDPAQRFVGQCDGSDFDNQVDLGLNCDILATAGNSSYKISRMEVDSSTLATTATLPIKILGFLDRQDGKNEMGEFTKVIFKINNHQLGSSTGTAGV